MVVAMGVGRQVMFWVAAFVALVLTLWLLSEILLPFVVGMALAYLLNPLVGRLERMGMNRLVAVLLVAVLFIAALAAILLLVVPLLVDQVAAFLDNVPRYVDRVKALIANPSSPLLKKILGEGGDASLGNVVSQGASWLTTFLASLWTGGAALVSIISLIVVTPVVAFYLLYDWERMIATVDGWVPVHQRETLRGLGREIDMAIAGFLRGQSAVCVLLGTFYAVGMTLVGLNFGLLIGLIAGLITFIPYVGSMTGLVLATAVAVAQFWPEWTWILAVVGIFLVGQFLEGNILSPKLVGDSVGLHPVWLMFALLAFSYLFGFVGLLLAVPLAAAVGVIARFALRRYLASPFYTGEEPKPPEEKKIAVVTDS